MSLFDMLFGGGGEDAANKYLDQIPDLLQKHLGSYSDRGGRAGNMLEGVYGGMVNDPMGYINNIMSNYKPSEGYQYQQDLMGQSAANAAAAGGQRGGGAEQAEQQRITQGLLGMDMQNWLKNVMGAQGIGMQGEQDFYKTGFGADSNISDSLANLMGTKATNAYKSSQDNGMGDLLGLAITAAGAVGGLPVAAGGSLLGNYLGKKWGL